jgi:membrane protein implicated in regulation of membrane protease activity
MLSNLARILVALSSPTALQKAFAAAYAIGYLCTVVWAMGTGQGATGGMAFVIPFVIGLPSSLLLVPLFLLLPLPKSLAFLFLLVLPVALNTWLILRVRGRIRSPGRNDRPEADLDGKREGTKSAKEG